MAPLTGKNSTQPLLFAELLAITGKHLANLKSPEARLAGLQIPASGLEQSWDRCGSQAAVVGQQRVADGHLAGIAGFFTGYQREMTDLLQACRTQIGPQASEQLLLGSQTTWLNRIGEV